MRTGVVLVQILLQTRIITRLTPPGPAARSKGMALISLDDLEGLDNDITDDISDDITEEQPMAEDRLLSHWQRVASTHQVSVPTEMTGPIHEMTQNSQQRETLPYAPISSHEKMGALQYEERLYPAGRWACVTRADGLYEQSISMAFMKLMRYICKENSLGRYLGMTVPVVSLIQMIEDGSGFQKSVLTGFFLPAQYQSCPPAPLDPEIQVQDWDPITVIARPFFGTTNESTVQRQISELWEVLAESDGVRRDRYMVAVFENPGVPQRRNEIWFLRDRI
ncbi:hypothetical protein NQD34_000012 [Periophthalmus magnuspinnatus]|nr:hypothetical protein NQD34_000012 [Periophthalmus magnuspinnatus]